jgi:hypothetical protein
MEGAAFFPMDALPELSEDRILEPQLRQLYNMVRKEEQMVYFD